MVKRREILAEAKREADTKYAEVEEHRLRQIRARDARFAKIAADAAAAAKAMEDISVAPLAKGARGKGFRVMRASAVGPKPQSLRKGGQKASLEAKTSTRAAALVRVMQGGSLKPKRVKERKLRRGSPPSLMITDSEGEEDVGGLSLGKDLPVFNLGDGVVGECSAAYPTPEASAPEALIENLSDIDGSTQADGGGHSSVGDALPHPPPSNE
jgi:hypothetical protein